MSFSFPKNERLLSARDFARVYGDHVFAADGVLVVQAHRGTSPCTRLGLSVSRKVGNAVVRNRWKRLIREAFRMHKLNMPQRLDIVVRPKRGAGCDAAAISQSLPKLVRAVARRLHQQERERGNS